MESVSCLETGFNAISVIPAFAVTFFLAFLAFKENTSQNSNVMSARPVTALSLRDKTLGNAGNGRENNSVPERGNVVPLASIFVLVMVVFGIKFFCESVHIGYLPSNLSGIIIVLLAGLVFVTFMTSLALTAALLVRARMFKLAEHVANLNIAIHSTLSPQSYEAALAYALQAEIAQEQMNYPRAIELSKKALNAISVRRNIPNRYDGSEDQRIVDLMAKYEQANSPIEALCHESLGCILPDMGRIEEAMEHAKEGNRVAQKCMQYAGDGDVERYTMVLAGALTLRGRCAKAKGMLDEARSDLEEAVKIRKQLKRQFEERTTDLMAELASTLSMQSENRKAEAVIQDAMKLVEGSNASSHRLAKTKLQASLAEVKMRTGHFAEAEKLLDECLDTREKLLQKGHPEIAKALLAIASLREAQGKSTFASNHRQTANEMLAKCFDAQRAVV